MKRIAIFASGSGSNMQKIVEHFEKSEIAEIALVLSNNPDAYVLERADNLEIPTLVFNKHEFYDTTEIVEALQACRIDFVVLAGFLWLIPISLIKQFPNKIINLHPALLPLYGGKGMYGHHVHNAVKANNEKETGITIHFVNEKYDEGAIVFQKATELTSADTIDDITFKVQQLEHHYFPRIVEDCIKKMD